MELLIRNHLRTLSANIRIRTIHCMANAGGGHIGGAMSIADVLAVLYGAMMKYDANKPKWEERDRLIVSKGHCGPAVYATLSLCGFFPEEWLNTLNQGGTFLPSHCDINKTPGIDMTTGSLGQGISCACGMAYALRKKEKSSRVYVVLGDGELQEGQVWEAIQFAAHHNLKNMTIIIDNNKKQLDGYLEEICIPLDLSEKFKSFGLFPITAKGDDVEQIYNAIDIANKAQSVGIVILNTIKGIGCNFAEKSDFNHYMQFTSEMALEAELEIRRRLELGIV